MEIGLSTACFYPLETEFAVEKIKEAGLKKAEVFLNSVSETDPEFCAMLKKRFDDAEIDVISVHSFVAMHEPFLFADYKRRQDDAIEIYKKNINAGKILGAKFHTFHGARQEMFSDEFDYEKFGETLTFLSELAGEKGLKLAWENVSWCLSKNPKFIEKILPFIKSEHFGFTLDLKQAIRASFNYLEYLKIFKEKLLNVHVSDADEFSDCLLPGDGNVDFSAVFSEIKKTGYEGDFIIEVYNDAISDMESLIKTVEFLKGVLKS